MTPGRVTRRVAKNSERPTPKKKEPEAWPRLKTVLFALMEPFHLELAFTPTLLPEFRQAAMYPFLRLSQRLPEMRFDDVKEFVINYNMESRASIVHDRTITIDEILLNKALMLPISEIDVFDCEVPADFHTASYFKSGDEAFEAKHGWKTAEARSLELLEWMRFAKKRLVLGRHGKYVAKRFLYPIVQTMNGMVFNWASFVASRIHTEIESKRKAGSVTSLLCSNYISEAIRYQLSQPDSDTEVEKSKGQDRVAITEETTQVLAVREEPTQALVVRSEPPSRSPSRLPPRQGIKRKFTQEAGPSRRAPQRPPGTLKERVFIGLQQLTEWVANDTEPEEEELRKELEDAKLQVINMRKQWRVMEAAQKVAEENFRVERIEKEALITRHTKETEAHNKASTK